MSHHTLTTFRAYVARCRPVWTLTWRDSVAPSIRSGVPTVREEDTYFNHELAAEYILEFGRKTLRNRLLEINEYIADDVCKYQDMVYKVRGAFNYAHKVHTPERDAWNYFVCCVMHVCRHSHKFIHTTGTK